MKLLFFYLWVLLGFQAKVPLKPSSDFEIITNYELRKKPDNESAHIIFSDSEKRPRNDVLPYLSLKLKVKKWTPGVTQIKITDSEGKVHLKKKPNDDGNYLFELGFLDDMKDKVTPGKFFINFLEGKTQVEQITISIEEDGTFLINGEKRGKF